MIMSLPSFDVVEGEGDSGVRPVVADVRPWWETAPRRLIVCSLVHSMLASSDGDLGPTITGMSGLGAGAPGAPRRTAKRIPDQLKSSATVDSTRVRQLPITVEHFGFVGDVPAEHYRISVQRVG
jgi:hypothetical protein